MVEVLKTDGGSVSRSVYSQLRRGGCTLFAHVAVHLRTVVVRIGGGDWALAPAAAVKGLKSVVFHEMASFLLSPL
ncbi:hypothetical protein [Pseudomonas frederiksbergensis]|uniref:hypothetical protein n=1 Tax=Pseudomonas frederiksbergensis TaxID=104087 RepID=UPI00101AE515|nr:hypothetical protein [Pseudomonas frederiksbergensis]